MRQWTCLLMLCATAFAQAQLRVNELQCTRTPGSDGERANGDWIELYNAGEAAVQPDGYVISSNGRVLHLPEGPAIAAKGYYVLWCDKAPERGPGHLDMKLSRHGGSLLLAAPDGSTVLDVFSWPTLPPGTSIGRNAEGRRVFFGMPTPGAANADARAATELLAPPAIACHGDTVKLAAAGSAEVRYTLDGSMPKKNATRYTGPFTAAPGTVVHARSFAADALPSICAVLTSGLPDSAWALMVAPEDLWGGHGIADVPSGNHARKGRAWQRQALAAARKRQQRFRQSARHCHCRQWFPQPAQAEFQTAGPRPFPQ